MSVSSTTNRVSYTGDGSSATFSFPYYFASQSDLKVYLYNSSTSAAALQTLNTNYTVGGSPNLQGIYPSGGSVIFTSSIPSSLLVVLTRDPSQVQNYALLQNGQINSAALVQQLDYLTLLAQRLQDEVSRAIRLPDGFGLTFDPTLPYTIPVAAGQSIIVNSAVNGFTFNVLDGVYTPNTLIYAPTASAVHSLGGGAQGYVLMSNGSSAPSWVQLSLSGSGVSIVGALTVSAGGTGQSNSFTQGGVIYASSATQLAGTAGGGNDVPLVGNGAGAPSFRAIPLTSGSSVTGVLPTTSGGTGVVGPFNQYGVIYASSATQLATVPSGPAGYVLTAQGSSAPTFQVAAAGVSVGTIDSVTASPNAIVIQSSVLYMQTATATNPGIVNSSAQTLAGVKTFSSIVNTDGGISRSTAGTLTVGADANTNKMIFGNNHPNMYYGFGLPNPQGLVHFGYITGSSNVTSGTVGSSAIIIGAMSTSNNVGVGAVIIGGAGGANTASGAFSLSIGAACRAEASFAVALGNGALAQAASTFAAGNGAQVTSAATNGISLGNATQTTGQNGVSVGLGTVAQGFAQTVVGEYNAVTGTPGSRVAGEDVFIVGCGTSGNKATAFSVNRNKAVNFWGTGSSQVSVSAQSSFTSYQLVLPSSNSSGALQNDGSGNLSWAATAISSPTSVSANYNILTSDLIVIANSSNYTVNLYGATGNAGRSITIKKGTTTGSSFITVAGSSATIDGVSTIQLPDQGDYMSLFCDGSNWQIQHDRITCAAMYRKSNNHGSTNTKIRKWVDQLLMKGNAFTVANDATNGFSVTINLAGRYSFSYGDSFTAQGTAGLSLNSNQLTSNIAGINSSAVLAMSVTIANAVSPMTWSGNLKAGDVVRPHTEGDVEGSALDRNYFTAQRV